MNTNQIIKNRNNGKSKNYYNHTQENIILTDNDDQNKLNNKDLSLFKMARTFNVEIGYKTKD